MSKIKLALSSRTLAGLEPQKIVEIASNAHIDGIEWAARPHLPHGQAEKAEALMMLTLRNGLTNSSYGSQYQIGLADQPNSRYQDFAAIIETCRYLQIPVIRIWASPVRPSGLLQRAAFNAQIHRIADMAGNYGMSLALEPHIKSHISRYRDLLDLIEGIDHPYFKACWSPLPDSLDGPRSARLGSSTAIVHTRNSQKLLSSKVFSTAFLDVFYEYYRQNQSSHLDHWLVLDHLDPKTIGALEAEIDLMRELSSKGEMSARRGT